MDNLIKTVEIFLAHSEEKLEELAEKNQALKTERGQTEIVTKVRHNKK